VLKGNVFYNMSLTKLKQLAFNYKEGSEDIRHYLENLELDELSKYDLIEILSLADSRMEYTIPKEKFRETVIFLVVLLLTRPRKEIFDEKKLLISTLVESNKIGDVYDSARLSFFIISFLYFVLNTILY